MWTAADLRDRTPILEECHTAAFVEVTLKKNTPNEQKITKRVPCPYIDGDECYCTAYLFPEKKWNNGTCPMYMHEQVKEKVKMINPIKESKRMGKK